MYKSESFWPQQPAILITLLLLFALLWIADKNHARRTAKTISALLAIYAVSIYSLLNDLVAALAILLLAAANYLVPRYTPISWRNTLSVTMVISAACIIYFDMLKQAYVFADVKIYIPYIREFLLVHVKGYWQWVVFVVIACLCSMHHFWNKEQPLKQRCIKGISVFLIAFWASFYVLVTLSRGLLIYDSPNFDKATGGIKAGLSVDATDSAGETTLHEAVSAGDIAKVKELVSRGADVNAESRVHGAWTPLGYAIVKNRYEIFEYLLDHGADITFTDKEFGRTYAHMAVSTGTRGDKRFLNRLLTKGIDIHKQDQYGNKPIHIAVGGGLLLREGYYFATDVFIEPLLKAGEDINAVGQFGTPLHSAVFHANTDAVKKLVALGANINAHDASGKSAVAVASNLLGINQSSQSKQAQLKAERLKEIISFLSIVTNNSTN